MKKLYAVKHFRSATLKIIEQANQIIAEYHAQGFELKLRQLYYQHVARGFIPNTDAEYGKLGSVINDARCFAVSSAPFPQRTGRRFTHDCWQNG